MLLIFCGRRVFLGPLQDQTQLRYKMRARTKVLLSVAVPSLVAIILALLWKRRHASNKSEETKTEQLDNDVDQEVLKLNAGRSDSVSEGEDGGSEQETVDNAVDNADSTEVPTTIDEAKDVGAQLRPNCKLSTDSQSTQPDSGIDIKSSLTDLNGSYSTYGEDTQSEGSVDSAALSSLADTKAPGYIGIDKEVWEIEFPQILCGRLIGRKGKNVKVISDQSGAKIRLIPQSPGEVSTHRIISITGDSASITSALDAIHDRFPTVPLTRINPVQIDTPSQFVSTAVSAIPYVQTVLPNMVNISAVVTSVVDARHFFIQLHNDVVQRQLQQLHQTMMQCYGQGVGPLLPQPILVGTYCAAPAYTYNGWYRAQVLAATGNPDEVEVRYLDYGGYGRIAASSLRQLRSDFLNCLPFQAVECYLANVAPAQGDAFSSVASAVFEDLTMNSILTARVVGQQNQLPCLELYLVQGDQTILVNRELVNRGLARWVES